MNIRRLRTGHAIANDCADSTPPECGQMFGIIAEGLDDLKVEVRESRKDVSAMNERAAAQEAKLHSAWHSIARIEERMNKLPREIADSIDRHETSCPGRRYADNKLLVTNPTPSSIPRPFTGDKHPEVKVSLGTGDFAGLKLPKWVIYLGAILGAAAAASGYILHALGVLGGG